MDLATLQYTFARALRAEPGSQHSQAGEAGQDTWRARADATPTESPAEQQAAALLVAGTVPIADRLAIYQRTSRVTQTQALALAYPVVAALVGEPLFAELAACQIAEPGSRSGNLHDFGAGFAQHLATHPACRAMPYLPEVAALEWLLHRAYFAAELPARPAIDPATIPPEALAQLTLLLPPGLGLLRTQTPAAAIWRAHQQPDLADLTSIDPQGGGEWVALWWRPEGALVERLDGGSWTLLRAIQAGATLAQGLDACGAEGAEPPDLAQHLPYWLQGGLVLGFALS